MLRFLQEKVDKKVPAETQIVPAKQPGKRPRVERTCVFCKVTSKAGRGFTYTCTGSKLDSQDTRVSGDQSVIAT